MEFGMIFDEDFVIMVKLSGQRSWTHKLTLALEKKEAYSPIKPFVGGEYNGQKIWSNFLNLKKMG